MGAPGPAGVTGFTGSSGATGFAGKCDCFIVADGRGVRRIGLTRLKPPPPKSPQKIIYSFKSGAFYVSQFVHPVADYVPPIQLIN